ncbi:MAG: AmmeMemoRadiSam system protein A [Isosphaeraceae bacterium]
MHKLGADERRFLLEAARRALETYLDGGERPAFEAATQGLREHRAAFVTLRTDGQLRGCRGEAEPRRPLIDSVIDGAIAAATDDPRFEPVGRQELDRATIHISALTPPRPVEPRAIELGRHGLILSYRGRSGLLLPQVPELYGLRTVDEFLESLRRKARLPEGVLDQPGVRLLGFEAEAWGEGPES